jgi:large exoprotein involved in heme utilization and adhesion
LLLRRGSEISTTAGAGGNGGNITINTPLLVAVPEENSDISANANSGAGGFIQITAQGIFGLERRSVLTPLSEITAISQKNPELNGVVEINTPDIDPSRGLVNLPTQPTDTQVAQACQPGGNQAYSEFVIAGRGGLPPNPGSALSTDAVQVDLITLNPEATRPSTTVVSTSPTSSKPARIVEAQGWVIDSNGKVILTANASTLTPHGSWHTPANCQVPKTSS